jgi:hypothetical protein
MLKPIYQYLTILRSRTTLPSSCRRRTAFIGQSQKKGLQQRGCPRCDITGIMGIGFGESPGRPKKSGEILRFSLMLNWVFDRNPLVNTCHTFMQTMNEHIFISRKNVGFGGFTKILSQ